VELELGWRKLDRLILVLASAVVANAILFSIAASKSQQNKRSSLRSACSHPYVYLICSRVQSKTKKEQIDVK
jgi:hypothetical protein